MNAENKISAPESQAHTDLGITDKDKVNGIVESQAHLLTEKDLIVGNRFECIEEFIYERNVFYYKGRIYDCRIGGRIRTANGFDFRFDTLTDLNRHFKLASQPPVMEGKEESLLAKAYSRLINEYTEVIKNNSELGILATDSLNKVAELEKENLSLQSEVEQLKGLLKESKRFCGGSLQARIDNQLSK